MTSDSVTVDGEDGLKVLAQAKGGPTTARLEFERKTSKVDRGHEVTYVFSKTRITQKLRLVINEGEDDMTFVVAEHDRASSFGSHDLGVSKDGRVVAYKLGDEQWQFIHVLTPTLAVHGPTQQERLSWSGVPDVSRDGFRAVYNAQSLRIDGTHSFQRQGPMLEWLRDEHGQQALARALFELISDAHHDWHERAQLLDEQGQSHLDALIRAELTGSKPHSQMFAIAIETGAIDLSEESEGLVARGVAALAADSDTILNTGTDLAEYLRVHAAHDPQDAAKVGCEKLAVTSDLAPNGLPYATDYGRPLALVSLAAIANAGMKCPAVADRAADPCTACEGEVCTPEFLDTAVARTLQTPIPKPAIGETPEDRDLAAVLAVAASGAEFECP